MRPPPPSTALNVLDAAPGPRDRRKTALGPRAAEHRTRGRRRKRRRMWNISMITTSIILTTYYHYDLYDYDH
eukprot:3589602-Pyramimonas_sp.AAC.1